MVQAEPRELPEKSSEKMTCELDHGVSVGAPARTVLAACAVPVAAASLASCRTWRPAVISRLTLEPAQTSNSPSAVTMATFCQGPASHHRASRASRRLPGLLARFGGG